MVKVICYGQEQIWESRDEAILFYLDGVRCCEGAERERYMNIYLNLIDGQDICTDDEYYMR